MYTYLNHRSEHTATQKLVESPTVLVIAFTFLPAVALKTFTLPACTISSIITDSV